MRLTYGDFRDPSGLVRRMLGSGDPAARSALLREPLGVGLRPLDAALAGAEQRLLREAPPSHQPLLLIVGGPRTGSTLLYQLVADQLDVSFPTNLSALFPRSPISAQSRFQSRQRRREHSRTPAYFGNTRGLAGVNDAFHMWNRWFGARRYQADGAVTREQRGEMRRFFDAWRAVFPQPFVNKNNRNSECIGLLAEVLPEAHFLVTRREPAAVVRSLLGARETIQGDRRWRWGLRSRDAADSSLSGVIDAVCEQLLEVEQRLQAGCAAVEPGRLIETTYEEVCADPANLLKRVATALDVQADIAGLMPLRARTIDETDPLVTEVRSRLAVML